MLRVGDVTGAILWLCHPPPAPVGAPVRAMVNMTGRRQTGQRKFDQPEAALTAAIRLRPSRIGGKLLTLASPCPQVISQKSYCQLPLAVLTG